jgi:hypothetical protein
VDITKLKNLRPVLHDEDISELTLQRAMGRFAELGGTGATAEMKREVINAVMLFNEEHQQLHDGLEGSGGEAEGEPDGELEIELQPDPQGDIEAPQGAPRPGDGEPGDSGETGNKPGDTPGSGEGDEEGSEDGEEPSEQDQKDAQDMLSKDEAREQYNDEQPSEEDIQKALEDFRQKQHEKAQQNGLEKQRQQKRDNEQQGGEQQEQDPQEPPPPPFDRGEVVFLDENIEWPYLVIKVDDLKAVMAAVRNGEITEYDTLSVRLGDEQPGGITWAPTKRLKKS